MNSRQMKDKKAVIQKSIMDQPMFFIGIFVFFSLIIAILFFSINTKHSLSHLRIEVLSGSTEGYYFASVEKMKALGELYSARILNRSSKGAWHNKKILESSADKCDSHFALVQDGMPRDKNSKMQLIAALPQYETMFFLAKEADRIKGFADLVGKKVGIGLKGSGTSLLSWKFFENLQLKDKAFLQNYSPKEQIELLAQGKLDVGIFVINDEAAIIREALEKYKLQIVSFREAQVISRRLPYIVAGEMPAGYLDPVAMIPGNDRKVMRVSTLLVGNGCASRSEIVGILRILKEMYPQLINHNLAANQTGLPYSKAAQNFFVNNGPEILDLYLPWLADLIPLGNIVQILMAVSVLFNIMGVANRFRLWRIDAMRVSIEEYLRQQIGDKNYHSLLAIDFRDFNAGENQWLQALDKQNFQYILSEFITLKNKCRKYSLSMLVPMGKEMSYRYQENLVDKWIERLSHIS